MVFSLGALVFPKPSTNKQHAHKTLLRVVKLTGILLVAAFLQVSARTTAQRLSISVRNGSLEKVFSEIEKKTNYVFFYDASLVQKTRPVTVEMKDASVEEVLRVTLKGQGLGFEIQDKTIFLKKEVIVAPTPVAAMAGGDGSITVQSETGLPLAGATVVIRKLKKSGMTNEKGEFVLKGIPNGEYEVEVTNVGYERHVGVLRVVDGEAHLAVQMKQATSGLDAMVVKGYYTTTNRLNTGDVTTVKGEDIQKQPVSDPILALIGRVPGLNIQQASGIPGAYAKISIRGRNSIANGNDPLYIIDGVPFSSLSLSSTFAVLSAAGYATANNNSTGGGQSPFNGLNPADIESVEVLKDADATAIYGSRGANGVILITTKKGKSGDTRLNLNVYTGAGSVAHKLKLLNTQQYLAMRREAYENDSLPLPSIFTDPYDYHYDINGAWDTTRYTDWQKSLIGKSASFTNAQGSIAGGNANTQFVIGGGYSRQGTVFPGNFADQKGSVRISLTHSSFNNRFGAQFIASYTNDNNLLPTVDFTSNIKLAPDAPALYDSKGNINWEMFDGQATFAGNVAAATIPKSTSVTNNLISNLVLHYEVLPGLQIKSSFGYNHDQLNQNRLTPASSYAPPYNNYPGARDNLFLRTEFSSWIIEPQVNYRHNIARGRLDVVVGSSFQQTTFNSLTQDANTFVSDALIPNPQAASISRILGAINVLYRYTAAYGRIGYNWQDKYLLNVTARRDGSSRFGPGKQFGNFGSGGIAWIFTKENFFQHNLRFLSFGKIRGSYGTTGNDQIKDYQWLSTYTANSLTYQGITNLRPTQLTNPYFAWEVVKKLEGGLELGFLGDHILIAASYYRNRTGNQLVGYPLPNIAGFTSVQYNLPAIVENSGLELVLNAVSIKSKNFEWNSSLNATIPSNKLVSFPGLAGSPYKNTYVVGKSIFVNMSFHNTGIDPQTGLYSFVTKNPGGEPSTPQDIIATRPVTQRFYGGFQNRFSYKGIVLDIFFQYVNQLGYDFRQAFFVAGIDNSNQPTAVLSRWQRNGDLKAIPRFGTELGPLPNSASYFSLSDGAITDASYLRLRNLVVSYQLPVQWTTKMHLQNARIYLQGENLFTITHYLGIDPEISGSLSLPPLRMITAGIQIGL